MDHFDYPTAATVWQRVNPQEDPYPDAGRGRFEMPQQQGDRPQLTEVTSPVSKSTGAQ